MEEAAFRSFSARSFPITASVAISNLAMMRTELQEHKDYAAEGLYLKLIGYALGREVLIEKTPGTILVPETWFDHFKSDLKEKLLAPSKRWRWKPYRTFGERTIERICNWLASFLDPKFISKTTLTVHHNHICPHVNVADHATHLNFVAMGQPWVGAVDEQAILREMMEMVTRDSGAPGSMDIFRLRLMYDRAKAEFESKHRIDYFQLAKEMK